MNYPETGRSIPNKINLRFNKGDLLTMPQRDWLHRVLAGGFLATALCALGVDVVGQGIGNDAGRQQRSAEPGHKPEPGNDPLALQAVQNAIDRIASAIEAQNDQTDAKQKNEREQSDLDAQWQMAKWAKYAWLTALASALVSLGALILTGVGVYLVWRTLGATRDAAIAAQAMVGEAKATTKAAQESVAEARKATTIAEKSIAISADSAQRQLRAYVVVQLHRVKAFNGRIRVTLTMRNTGLTPAKHHRSETIVELCAPYPAQGTIMMAYDVLDSGRRSASTIAAASETFVNLDLPWTKAEYQKMVDVGPLVFGIGEYHDVFGDTWRTKFAFHVRPWRLVEAIDREGEKLPDSHWNGSAFVSNQWNDAT